MERMLETLEATIPAGRTLRIRNAAGANLRVMEGTLWVTEENDPGDYILDRGDSRRIGTGGLTLAHVFQETRIAIEPGDSKVGVALGAGYRQYAAAVCMEQVAAVARRTIAAMRGWAQSGLGSSATLVDPAGRRPSKVATAGITIPGNSAKA